MDYKTITEDEKQAQLAVNIVDREHEIESYQTNIDNYESALALLPQEDWPESLVQYKGLPPAKVAQNVPDEHIEQVSQLLFRDRLRALLKTEKMEQSKAKIMRDAMIARADKTQLQNRVAAVKTTREELLAAATTKGV